MSKKGIDIKELASEMLSASKDVLKKELETGCPHRRNSYKNDHS